MGKSRNKISNTNTIDNRLFSEQSDILDKPVENIDDIVTGNSF